MSETTRVVVPYESMDPLAIGATDDDSKKHRDTLEIEIPTGEPRSRVVQPDEPAPVGDATEAARRALAEPVDGPTFADLLAGKTSVAVIIDNQFRPTPSSKLLPAVFDALEAAGITRRARLLREREGVPDVRVRHRAEGRAGQSRAHGAERLVVLAERPAEPRRVHLRRRLVGRHARLAPQPGRVRGGEDHHRPGAGQPLGRGRGREADPAGRGLRRDGRVEPLRVRHLAADALRRLRGADALRHRRGGDDVRPRLHDERAPRHARARDGRACSAPIPRRTGRRSAGSTTSTPTSPSSPSTARRTSRSAASSRRPTTSSSTPAGAACPPTSW